MGKFGWDLPPGCSINDIPGNRPEDMALEDAEQAIVDKLYEANATINDYHLIVALIKPLIETYQKEIALVQKEMNANHAEYMDWLKNEIYIMINHSDPDGNEIKAYKEVLKLLGEKTD